MSATALLLLQVIGQYGLPFVVDLIKTTKDDKLPTPEDWDRLEALVAKQYDDYVKPKV
jgi:hypothetical protein